MDSDIKSILLVTSDMATFPSHNDSLFYYLDLNLFQLVQSQAGSNE